jgi:hypothetical protein
LSQPILNSVDDVANTIRARYRECRASLDRQVGCCSIDTRNEFGRNGRRRELTMSHCLRAGGGCHGA